MDRSAVSALVSFVATSAFVGAALAWDVPSKRLSPTPPPTPSAGEPDVAASADGRTIYAAFAQNAAGNTSIFGVCSTNQGTSFTSPVLLADSAGGDHTPRIVSGYEPATERLLLHLTWRSANGTVVSYKAFSAPRATPCSLTAETAELILANAAGGFAGVSIATNGTDKTYVATAACTDVTGDCDPSNMYVIEVHYILNETVMPGFGGITNAMDELCREPDLAVAGGIVFLSYACDPVEELGSLHEIRSLWSDNDGAMWNGMESPIADAGVDMRLPAIAVHDSDTLYLAYDADQGGQEDLFFTMGTRTGAGVVWDTVGQESLNANFIHELDIASLPGYGVATVVWAEDTIFPGETAIRSVFVLNTGAMLSPTSTVSSLGMVERQPRVAQHPASAVWYRMSSSSAEYSRDAGPTAALVDRLRAVRRGDGVAIEGFAIGGSRVIGRREGWSAEPHLAVDGAFEALDSSAGGAPYFVDATFAGRTETYGPLSPEARASESAVPSCSATPRGAGLASIAAMLLAALAVCWRR